MARLCLLLVGYAAAYVRPPTAWKAPIAPRRQAPAVMVETAEQGVSEAVTTDSTTEADIEPPPPAELGPYLVIKGKSLNAFGALYGVQSVLLLGMLWWMALTLTEAVCKKTGWDEDRLLHDWVGKTWSRVNMAVGGCAPSVVKGTENLPPPEQAALYVSNHASWFDIPLVAQIIPNSFKFIAAAELKGLPLIGQQLVDGKHVLLDRSSRRGQLTSFKESVGGTDRPTLTLPRPTLPHPHPHPHPQPLSTRPCPVLALPSQVAYLKRGISIFAFPEGTRSRSGKMIPFKGGVFS